MKIFKYTILLWLLGYTSLQAQIIFTESLAPVIDTTRSWQGNIAPELNFKTEKDTYFMVKNNANVSFLLRKKKAITILNQVEIAKSGDKVNVSNGFVHMEYRYLYKPTLEVYPFAEGVWAPSRGLLTRVAGGFQLRYLFLHTDHFTWRGGVGIFYEYERWNYDGVPNLTTANIELYQQTIKSRLATVFEIRFTDRSFLQASFYIHNRIDSNVKNPRYAYYIDLKYKITDNLGLWLSYQAIQHTKPIVPVKKLYVVLGSGVYLSW